MKTFAAILSLLTTLGVSASFASVKPRAIEIKLNTDFSIPGSSGIDIAYVKIDGMSGTYCTFYNRSDKSVDLFRDQTLYMQAAYWDSEASWSEVNGELSMSCGGGRIGSHIRGKSLPQGAMQALNNGMRKILKVREVDLLSGIAGPATVTSNCHFAEGVVSYETSVHPEKTKLNAYLIGRHGDSALINIEVEGTNQSIVLHDEHFLSKDYVVHPTKEFGFCSVKALD